ncbi:MATE family efflux transporter [Agarilytica rhodophyticola]|uniref:MATE family efflux transporter n=1 Tax=Agarilytica rhodophyticola TaxID=1737490 RepID=UPI000B344C8D|nr:MATE family efflux transporter [Agarilytica rhodophyticola]
MSKKSILPKSSLAEGSISNILFNMAMPMGWGILATMSFNIVDTYFVAGLGDDALAALSFTFPIVLFAVSLSVGLGAGTSSVVAICAGIGDERGVRTYITDSITLTIVVTIFIAIVGILSIEQLFRSIGASEPLIALISEYMVLWYISILFFVAPMVGLSALRAIGNTKLQGVLMIAMAIANAILDPIFIYGWWIFPAMGIKGAAMASLVVRMLSFFVLIYYLHYSMHLFVNPFKFKRAFASWRKILNIGVPAMTTNVIVPLSNSVLLILVASHGADVVAGFGVASRVESFALLGFYALSAVIGPFCGHNRGAKEFQRLHDAQKITARFCIYTGLAISMFFAFFGREVAVLFSDELLVIEATYHYLLIVPVSYCAYGIVMVVNASFNGLGRPIPAVLLSSIRVLVILLPLAWIGNHYMGVWGILAAIAISNIIVGFVAYIGVHRTIGTMEWNDKHKRMAKNDSDQDDMNTKEMAAA